MKEKNVRNGKKEGRIKEEEKREKGMKNGKRKIRKGKKSSKGGDDNKQRQ